MMRTKASMSGAFLGRYDYTAQFFAENWAWDFLRRNEEFKAQALSHLDQSPFFSDTPCGAPIAHLPHPCREAEKWGLIYFPDPRRNCLQTNVFWSTKRHPRKLQVNVVPRSPGKVDMLKEKSLKHCKVFYLSDDQQHEHLIVRGKGCAIQVSCNGLSLLSADPVIMQVRAAEYSHPHSVASWLARLNQMLESDRSNDCEWAPNNERLRDTLVALDAYAAGSSLFETAVILYGVEEANRAWSGSSRAMKDRVRRLRQKGIKLRDVGYTSLLE